MGCDRRHSHEYAHKVVCDMIRIVIENILLFLLPTALFLGYRYVQRVQRSEQGSKGARQAVQNDFNDAPLLWLFVAGAALVLAVLIAFGSTDGGKPGQTYYPPVVKDGKVIPGHFK